MVPAATDLGSAGREPGLGLSSPPPPTGTLLTLEGAEQEPGTDTQLALVLSVTLSFATSTGHPRLCYQSRKILAMKE